MREIIIARKDLDFSKYIGRYPTREEHGELIDEPTLVKNREGKVEIAYTFLDEETVKEMRYISTNVRMNKAVRVHTGVPTKSAVFGVMPRVALRVDYCRFTAQSKANVEYFAAVAQMNKRIAGFYQANFPAEYAASIATVRGKVHEDWRYVDTPYLTCNFNVNHAIKFHTDTGNLDGFSNVLILKQGIAGGELVCPEYGISFSQRDRALLVFNGKTVLHGVAPLRAEPGYPSPYRSSIVFYTLAGMCNCLSRPEETKRLKAMRTAKEKVGNEERKAVFKLAAKHRIEKFKGQ